VFGAAYGTSGLPGGTHEYQAMGVNSRGEGAVSINVAQARENPALT
jgi:hypothetical protein